MMMMISKVVVFMAPRLMVVVRGPLELLDLRVYTRGPADR